ncbi:MAG: glycoside hydrolase family 2 sugar binding protein, partial [Bacteroidetes bacterium]|nr:glycoside hydrolase family 2 sugar binding protein [Bacteroidota bacterium]
MTIRKKSHTWLLPLLIINAAVGLQAQGGHGWGESIAQKNDKKRQVVRDIQPKHGDVFAGIGERNIAERRGMLEEIPPPKLPRKMLPTGQSDPSAAFTPLPKLDTPVKLIGELGRQRALYAPFLEDHAPGLPRLRDSLRLVDFQWRLETEADRADFLHTMSGAGEWMSVKVPHFGGPIGRAVAYYRTSFLVTRTMLDERALFVRFGGVDYTAHVFLNGHYLGSHEGFFAPFEFDCTASIREGDNSLLVKVENDAIYMGNDSWGQAEEGDKMYAATNLGWDDPEVGWHHCPPGFGIYQDVFIEARSPMHVADLWVRPFPEKAEAEAWIEVRNQDRRTLPASFEISVFGQNFKETTIAGIKHSPGTRIVPGVGDLQKPTDNQDVTLAMGPGLNLIKVPLVIPGPRLWDLQTPWLYQVQVRLLDGSGRVLDATKRQFGMRVFRQENNKVPRGRMFLNGREIKLRGANTMGFEQQDVFRKDFRQLVDDILLAKICNMNYLRLTQRPVQPEVYEYCDRLGLMTQTDLPLFGCLRYNKFAEAVRQTEEMERLVRGHACNIMISYINEPFPNASGKPHRHLTRTDLEAFFRAADGAVRTLNPDRVIKHIEGDYDPPSETLPDNHCYCGWYNGHGLELGKLHKGYWMPVSRDWLYACGEFGAEGLDPADLMRRRYPREWLPGADESSWSPGVIPGAQTGNFHYMWFDTQRSLEEWVRASQRHQAWATRLFAERFRRDNRMAGFAIHLFIDAFPASWMKTIMDCERRPKPAYFAYRDALEPLTVNIRTDRRTFTSGEAMTFEFWVCNDTQEKSNALSLKWQIEQEGQVL